MHWGLGGKDQFKKEHSNANIIQTLLFRYSAILTPYTSLLSQLLEFPTLQIITSILIKARNVSHFQHAISHLSLTKIPIRITLL